MNKNNLVYCPLCKKKYSLKKYEYKKSIYLYLAFILIGTGISIYLGKIYIQIFFSIFPLMIITEYGKRLSTRFSLSCPHCGFDVISYSLDKKKTVLKVNNYYKTKKNNYNRLMNLGL